MSSSLVLVFVFTTGASIHLVTTEYVCIVLMRWHYHVRSVDTIGEFSFANSHLKELTFNG